jgi:DNA-binding IclR family transcriptional regulator
MTTVQSLERGIAILSLLDATSEPLGIREIARRLGLSPPIVQRLANTLANEGLIEQVKETRRYRLGFRAISLGNSLDRQDKLLATATAEMRVLANEHFLTSYLGVLRGTNVVYLHAIQGRGPVVVRVAPGGRVQPHATAIGKALLAELPPAEVSAVVGRTPYPAVTSNSVTTKSALAAELDRVRKRGFAIALDENILGVSSIGAVIRDSSNHVVAALSIAFPTKPHTKAEWADQTQLVLDAAYRCSRAIGYGGAEIRLKGSKDAA